MEAGEVAAVRRFSTVASGEQMSTNRLVPERTGTSVMPRKIAKRNEVLI